MSQSERVLLFTCREIDLIFRMLAHFQNVESHFGRVSAFPAKLKGSLTYQVYFTQSNS